MPSKNRTGSDWAALVGIIILALIVLWGLFHALRLASPWFSSILPTFKKTAAIEVSAPDSVKSGDDFSVTWKYSTSASGIYTFMYQCQGAVSFETAAAGGGDITIPCGAAFTVNGADKKITLT